MTTDDAPRRAGTRARYSADAPGTWARRPAADAAPGTAQDTSADGDGRPPAREGWAPRLALLLVALLGAGLVGLHIHGYRQLSQYDEGQHVDYVYNLLQGHVPASGDRWLPPTTLAVACRTIDSPFPYPPCDPSSDNRSGASKCRRGDSVAAAKASSDRR